MHLGVVSQHVLGQGMWIVGVWTGECVDRGFGQGVEDVLSGGVWTGWGVRMVAGDVYGREVCVEGVYTPTTEMATDAVSTQPTGMHSCF